MIWAISGQIFLRPFSRFGLGFELQFPGFDRFDQVSFEGFEAHGAAVAFETGANGYGAFFGFFGSDY